MNVNLMIPQYPSFSVLQLFLLPQVEISTSKYTYTVVLTYASNRQCDFIGSSVSFIPLFLPDIITMSYYNWLHHNIQ